MTIQDKNTVTIKEVCEDQLKQVQFFARGGNFKEALATINCFRMNNFDANNEDVKKANEIFLKAEKMLLDRI